MAPKAKAASNCLGNVLWLLGSKPMDTVTTGVVMDKMKMIPMMIAEGVIIPVS